jgi:hypothetical protein
LTATSDTIGESQPTGDQSRESQLEAVKDNPPRAPTAQRPTSFTLKSRDGTGGALATDRLGSSHGRRPSCSPSGFPTSCSSPGTPPRVLRQSRADPTIHASLLGVRTNRAAAPRPSRVGLREEFSARLDHVLRDRVELTWVELHHVLVFDVVRLVDELLEGGIDSRGDGIER